MVKKERSRAVAKKMKDKWKAKQWYKIVAPKMFNYAEIGETIADEPAKIIGRHVNVTAHDLTGDFSKSHIKLQLELAAHQGSNVYTTYVGHTLTSDYLRRMTRRRRSKTERVFTVKTKDGFKVIIKPVAVTEKRISGSQKSAIGNIMEESMKKQVGKSNVDDLIRSFITGKLAKQVAKDCKKIQPTVRIEVRKSEVVSVPKGQEELIPPEPTEEEVEEEKAEEATEEKEAPEKKEDAPAEEEVEVVKAGEKEPSEETAGDEKEE